jgi:TonB family protein
MILRKHLVVNYLIVTFLLTSAYVWPAPFLKKDVIDKNITGWVVLENTVDEQGNVSSTKVINSSNHLLEESAREAALEFVYKPRYSANGNPIKVSGVRATIVINYFDLAREKGCAGLIR